VDACTRWSYSIALAAEPVSASRSRSFVRDHLGEHGLSHLSDDVELVVSELATNAAIHAHTPFTVSLHAFEATVLLEVEDACRDEPLLVAADVLDCAGRGVAIVDLLSRDWGVSARAGGRKSVWAEFAVTSRPESDARAGAPTGG
jgi:anti-sigma regulatory factor (Ser/Thr protein kinase)